MKNRGSYVPFHHQYLLAQTIKGFILLGKNPAYTDYNHYNFSGLKGQIKISRKGLHFYSSKVTLVFSASDKDFIDYFTTVLFEQKEIMIGNMLLVPEAIEQEDPVVVCESVRFLCISPLVLIQSGFNDESGKRFILPEADEFSDLLYDSTIQRMEQSGRYTPAQLAEYYKFQIIPDQEYLSKIQSSHKKFARIYPVYDSDVKFEVRGYTFPFTLYAPVPVQQFIYENGLGYFTHKGFGMLDVAGSDVVKNPAESEETYVSAG